LWNHSRAAHLAGVKRRFSRAIDFAHYFLRDGLCGEFGRATIRLSGEEFGHRTFLRRTKTRTNTLFLRSFPVIFFKKWNPNFGRL
jgi:hypothetical protein